MAKEGIRAAGRRLVSMDTVDSWVDKFRHLRWWPSAAPERKRHSLPLLLCTLRYLLLLLNNSRHPLLRLPRVALGGGHVDSGSW